MRAGAITVQQTLTSEAASVLKHSLSLARRRGHSQVTPLHVAATLLTLRLSLLKRACLKSQPIHQSSSHPLQCRALELCFNVALNRLPITPAGPILHGQPSLSNALIAALKRAQAHQRRGCIEQQQHHNQELHHQHQQQPLLAVKVELEQLILSILDDPSVSRVMREAGFSSTAVKNNLEDCSSSLVTSSVFQYCYSNSSGGIYSTPSSPPTETKLPGDFNFLSYSVSEQNPFLFSPQRRFPSNPIIETGSIKEDIKFVVEVLVGKKKRNNNIVIVGDSVSITESLVGELMSKVENGDVPQELKSVHFIKLHFAAANLKFMKREEVEVNISDLKRKIENLVSGGRGIVIYTGDLKWAVDVCDGDGDGDGDRDRDNCDQNLCGEKFSGYSPVNHLVVEIGRLVSFYGSSSSNSSNSRVWLLATANYQTYMRCQMKQPPLDIQWALQAVSVPSAGLGLSLNASSVHETNMTLSQNKFQVMEKKPITGKEDRDAFTCCSECTSNYEKDLGLLTTAQLKSSSLYSNSSCKDNELPYWLKPPGRSLPEKDDSVELKRKWSKLCQSIHQGRQNQNNISSLGKNYAYSSYPWWPSYNSIFMDSKSISFADPSLKLNQNIPNSVPRFRRQQSCHIEFNFSNGNSKCEEKEPNLDSLKNREDKEVKITLALGNSEIPYVVNGEELIKFEKEQKESVALSKLLQEIVPWQSENIPPIVEALVDSKTMKKDVWMLIQGNDFIGKRRLALGIAEYVFGSETLLFDFNMRNRDNTCEMLENALRNPDKLVVLVEDVDFAHPEILKLLADGFGKRESASNKRNENHSQVIYILTKTNRMSYRNGCRGKQDFVIQMKLLVDERIRSSSEAILSSDHKRKAEWNFTHKSKSSRKELSRQFSSNALDLNMKAEEESEGGLEEFSPASSDLTTNDQNNPLSFLELIKYRFVFNRDLDEDSQKREVFFSKIKGSFEEVFGSKNLAYLTVEENVLEEISVGSGSFFDSLFERWLKEIFQTSLVSMGRKDGINIKLCLESNGEIDVKDHGFQGSCLPKNIHISSLD